VPDVAHFDLSYKVYVVLLLWYRYRSVRAEALRGCYLVVCQQNELYSLIIIVEIYDLVNVFSILNLAAIWNRNGWQKNKLI
jgi:hypothetical protein